MIKKKAEYKKSGYFWVKTVCSKNPIRVYCNFETPYKQAYAFIDTTRGK